MFSSSAGHSTRAIEIASIACLHNFFRHVLLFCSEILTYQLLGSQLWVVLSTENSRSPATAIDCEVSKLRHNSKTKLYIQVCHAVHKLTGCKAANCRQFCLQRSLKHYQQPSKCAIHTVTYTLTFKSNFLKFKSEQVSISTRVACFSD